MKEMTMIEYSEPVLQLMARKDELVQAAAIAPILGMKAETIVETAKTRTRPEAAAADLLKRCREFYTNPQNEREFEEWKKKKSR